MFGERFLVWLMPGDFVGLRYNQEKIFKEFVSMGSHVPFLAVLIVISEYNVTSIARRDQSMKPIIDNSRWQSMTVENN